MVTFSELVPEEKHRILICCIMGLVEPNGSSNFPNPLHHLDYEIAILEWDTVLNSKGRKVSPDLVLVDSADNHAMVVECKSSKLEKDQIERYMDVRREDIVDWGISSTDSRQLTHDITLVASYENSDRILATLPQWNCVFPTLEVGMVAITKIANNFSRDELNRVFPVSIRLSYAPQYLYPVGRESPDHIVMELTLQTLLSKLYSSEREEFVVSLEDVIIDIFPYWNEMGREVKEKVREKIQRVIAAAGKSDTLKRYIEYHEREIKFRIPNYRNTRAVQAFERAGAHYISNLKKQYVQKTLENW